MNILENPLFKNLLSLKLPKKDFAIFGSGPMFIRGIKDLGHDIDIIARGKAWEKAKELGPVQVAVSGSDVISLFDDTMEIYNMWAPGMWDTDELIDNANVVEKIRFVRLEDVIKWKKLMNRPKDIEHIKMIEKYLFDYESKQYKNKK